MCESCSIEPDSHKSDVRGTTVLFSMRISGFRLGWANTMTETLSFFANALSPAEISVVFHSRLC